MHKIVTHALWRVLIAGGISLLGATAANAAETDGDDSLLGGTQALIEAVVPVDVRPDGV